MRGEPSSKGRESLYLSGGWVEGWELGRFWWRGTSMLRAIGLSASLPFKSAAGSPGALPVWNSAPSYFHFLGVGLAWRRLICLSIIANRKRHSNPDRQTDIAVPSG